MQEILFSPATQKLYQQLNQDGNRTTVYGSVKSEFEQQVKKTPHNSAVVFGDITFSYTELNSRANAIAAELIKRGVSPGSMVAICSRRSAALVQGLLAIIKCGASYVPIDPTWPEIRIKMLLQELSCSHAIAEDHGSAKILPENCEITEIKSVNFQSQEENPALDINSGANIYVNFTSGSTGRPKAVPIQHKGVLRLVRDANFTPLGPETRTLHLSPIAFDAATFEIWAPLLNGGTCVVFGPHSLQIADLKIAIKNGKINTIFLTTALFNTIIDVAPETLDNVPHILTGGEAHSTKHMVSALNRYGTSRVTSVYGSTECTTFSTYYPVNQVKQKDIAIPIGKPIQETGIYILDGNRACGVGEFGVIHVTGPGLSSGYHNDPEQTSKRFKDVLIDGTEHRIYNTGDIGKLSKDLNIWFEGREDDQVKVNGHRIELGEVSHQLNRLCGVKQSYVTTTRTKGGENQLIAFILPEGDSVGTPQINVALQTVLPAYMIPRLFLRTSPFPLTETNKIDKKALLAQQKCGSEQQSKLKKSAAKIQEILISKGISTQVYELPSSTRTAEDAANALNCNVEQIVKSLVFERHDNGCPVIVLASGANLVDVAKIGKLLGTTVGKASAKYVKDQTGFTIGGVPPIGHKNKSHVVVDEDLLVHESVWAAAGTPNAVFKISGPINLILDDFTIATTKETDNA